MKGNLYYHFFYLLTKFSKWINKRNSEYAFSGMAYLSVCMVFNVMAILFAFEIFSQFNAHLLKWHIFLSLAIIGLNYILLMRNGKHKQIINHYDGRDNQNKKKSVTVLLVCEPSLISSFCA